MNDLISQSAAALAQLVRGGMVSAREVVGAHLAKISARDPILNCCTETFAASALSAAEAIDARRKGGGALGPLAGVPVAIKNLFDIEGVVTLAGAQSRRKALPARRDAAAIARLKAADAVIVAATNMDEYAYGFTTENAFFGVTRNPRAPDRLAGGSSGGSAAAVAAGMAALGLGTDTNGSIRVPASFCGVFGLKPTFGRVSRAGVMPFVASLDTIGPMARTVEDLALAYDALQGHDPEDPVCSPRPTAPVRDALRRAAPPLRVGVLGGWFRHGGDAAALAAVAAAADILGATEEVELAQAEIARTAAFVITASEGGAVHRDGLRKDAAAFDPSTRDRLIAGALLPAELINRAQRFRRRFQAVAAALFERFDVLLAPATPCAALPIGQRTLSLGDQEMLARAHIGVYTQPLSFVGLPIVTAPILRPDSLPIGVQIVAAPWREIDAFRAALALEQAGLACAPVAAS